MKSQLEVPFCSEIRSNILSTLYEYCNDANSLIILEGAQGVGKTSILEHFHSTSQEEILLLRHNGGHLDINYNHIIKYIAEQIQEEERFTGWYWKSLLKEADIQAIASDENQLSTLIEPILISLNQVERIALLRRSCLRLIHLYSIHGDRNLIIAFDNFSDYGPVAHDFLRKALSEKQVSNKIKFILAVEPNWELNFDIAINNATHKVIIVKPFDFEQTRRLMKRLNCNSSNMTLNDYKDIFRKSKGEASRILKYHNLINDQGIKSQTNVFEAQPENLSIDEYIKDKFSSLNQYEMENITTVALLNCEVSNDFLYDLIPHKNENSDILQQFLSHELLDTNIIGFNSRNLKAFISSRLCNKETKQKLLIQIMIKLLSWVQHDRIKLSTTQIAKHVYRNTVINFNFGDEKLKGFQLFLIEAIEDFYSNGNYNEAAETASFLANIRKSHHELEKQVVSALNTGMEAAFLVSSPEIIDECIYSILHRSSNIDTNLLLASLDIATEAYVKLNKSDKVFEYSIKGLSTLNFHINSIPSIARVAIDVFIASSALKSLCKQTTDDRKQCNDKRITSILRFLARIAHMAYGNHNNLFAVACSRILILSHRHGFGPETGYFVQTFANSITFGRRRQLSEGNRYRVLLGELDNPEYNFLYKARADACYHIFIHQQLKPLRENIILIDKDFNDNIEAGAYEMAGICAHMYSCHAFDLDLNTDSFYRKIDGFQKKMSSNQSDSNLWIRVIKQFLHDNIIGTDNDDLEGNIFSYQQEIINNTQSDHIAIFIASHYSMLKSYLKGSYENALSYEKTALKYRSIVPGTYGEFLSLFIIGMLYSRLNFGRSKITKAISKLSNLTNQGAVNLSHKVKLLHAALSYVDDNVSEAAEGFVAASGEAFEKGFWTDAIIGYEFAADIGSLDQYFHYNFYALDIAEQLGNQDIKRRLKNKISREILNETKVNITIPVSTHLTFTKRCSEDICNETYNSGLLINEISKKIADFSFTESCSWEPFEEVSNKERSNYNTFQLEPELNGHVELHIKVSESQFTFGYYNLTILEKIWRQPEVQDSLTTVTRSLATKLFLNKTYKQYTGIIETYRDIYSDSSEGFLLAKNDGVIINANPAFFRLLGIDVESISFNLLESLTTLSKSSVSQSQVNIETFLSGINSCYSSDVFVSSTDRHLKLNLKRITAKKLIFVQLTDVTEKFHKEKAQDKIIQQARYFASACHEIKNPLQGAIGWGNLANEAKDEQLKINYFQNQYKGMSELRPTIHDILSIGQIMETKLTITPEAKNLKKTLIEFTDMQKALAMEGGVKLYCNVKYDGFISVDFHRIGQVLRNLLLNAIKYSKAKRITITVDFIQEPTPSLHIKISDDGVGIPKDKLDTLFTPFERAGEEDHGGSGLGLHICKQIIESMRGEISVNSSSSGTAFYVITPAEKADGADAQTLNTSDVAEMANYLQQLDLNQVVIVDDNREATRYAEIVMQPKFKKVITFERTDDAFDYIQSNAPDIDLLLTDYKVPPYNGIELDRKVKLLPEFYADTWICTGETDKIVEDNAKETNARVAIKPIELHTLNNIVNLRKNKLLNLSDIPKRVSLIEKSAKDRNTNATLYLLKTFNKQAADVSNRAISEQTAVCYKHLSSQADENAWIEVGKLIDLMKQSHGC